MTPTQRQQLDLLAEEQRRLAATITEFGARLDAFAADLKSAPAPLEAEPAPKAPMELPVIPPPLPDSPAPASPNLPPAAARTSSTIPPPPDLPATTPPVVPADSATPPPLPPAPSLPNPVAPPAPAEPASLEMQIGTVWLARIGIVILVTGLVFLGNYARQFIVAHLGPAGKVTLLFTSAALLGGIGLWLERRAATRRFAQVLIAGGAAMAYYTTYAAHFVPRLRIIQNPLLAGLLLLAVAAIFIWWSDRRRLQTAAMLAIGLSYYTAAINPIGTFTLYSSLVLTAAAGFLLIRNGWALISWVSLAGTYVSFAFWRFHQAVTHAVPDFDQPWNAQVLLLAGYWTLFTAPVFLAPERSFPYYRRSAFLTLNNALFFWLASEHLSRTNPDGFWGFCLVFGAVLLALSALASRRRPEAFVFDGAYLVQGLAAVTAGFAAKLTGNSLAITLAAESVILLTGTNRRHGAIYQVAAAIVAVWAFILSLPGIAVASPVIQPAAAGVAALFLLSAWWLKQRLRLLASMAWSFRAAGFVQLAVVLLSLVLMHHARAPWQPAALAGAALVSAASIYFLRLPELALLGQTFLGVAFAMWIPADLGFAPFSPWWQPLPLVLGALALCHWWPNQRILWAGRIELVALHLASSLVAIVVSFFWLGGSVHGSAWIVSTAAVGTATVVYGLLTGAWGVSLFGQLFAYVSLASLLPWAAPLSGRVDLAPVLAAAATTAILHFAPAHRWPAPIRPALPTAVLVYWTLTSLLAVAWIFAHVQTDWRPLTLVGIGVLLALLQTSSPAILLTALAFLALGYLTFILRYPAPPVWQDLLAILLAPATLRIRRRLAPDSVAAPPEAAIVSSAATTAAVWHWLTRWIMAHDRAETLTLAWSGLAVAFFIAGLALRDRIYRRGGLALLALGVGRIILIDVWRLDTIYRIITLLVLGVVLLSLSYVYNRYSDRIKRWL